MTNFNDFINTCGEKLNNHDLNLCKSFSVWKKIFDNIRSGSTEKIRPGFSQPVLQGIISHNLSDEEAFFILSYTASFSSWINLSLRRGDCLTECQEYYANRLEFALAKLPKCACEYLYRMDMPLCNKTEELNWFESKKGCIIKIPNFLSVAKSNWNNTEIIWKISTIRGKSNAIDLAQCRNNPSEDEAIFKRNSLFKIRNVNKDIIFLEEVENISTPVIEVVGNYAGCN